MCLNYECFSAVAQFLFSCLMLGCSCSVLRFCSLQKHRAANVKPQVEWWCWWPASPDLSSISHWAVQQRCPNEAQPSETQPALLWSAQSHHCLYSPPLMPSRLAGWDLTLALLPQYVSFYSLNGNGTIMFFHSISLSLCLLSAKWLADTSQPALALKCLGFNYHLK